MAGKKSTQFGAGFEAQHFRKYRRENLARQQLSLARFFYDAIRQFDGADRQRRRNGRHQLAETGVRQVVNLHGH